MFWIPCYPHADKSFPKFPAPREELSKPHFKKKCSETCLKRNLDRRNLAFSGKFSRFRGTLSSLHVWNGTCLQRKELLPCDLLYTAFTVLLYADTRYCSVVQVFVLPGCYSSSICIGYRSFRLTYGTDILSRNVCNKLPTYVTRYHQRSFQKTNLTDVLVKRHTDIAQQLGRDLPSSKAISFTRTVVVSMKFWLNY